MAASRYLIAFLLAAGSAPAIGAVVTIGNSSALLCYRAADSRLVATNLEMGHCDDALTNESLSPQDRVATYVNRGILRLRRGQVDAAIADFDRAIALDPMQPEAYLNKGAALIRLNNPSEAVQLFTVALERNTSRPELAHFGRALANETLGNARAAYQDYQRASELDPEWEVPRAQLRRFRVVRQ